MLMIFFCICIFVAPSRPPQDLTSNAPSPTTIHLSWRPPPLEYQNGVIRGYNITITNADIASDSVRVISTDQTSINVFSLHPHYNYTCSVAAYTVGIGPDTNHLVMMPEDGKLTTVTMIVILYKLIYCGNYFPPVPSGSPTILRLTNSNSRTLQLSWQPPPLDQQNGVIRRYEVRCVQVESVQITAQLDWQ